MKNAKNLRLKVLALALTAMFAISATGCKTNKCNCPHFSIVMPQF